MKKHFVLFLVVAMTVISYAIPMNAQDTLQRWVIGSGGSIFESNGDTLQISGILGQTAIFTLSQTGVNDILHQGFWVPQDSVGVGVDDKPFSLSPDLMNYPNPFSTNTTIRYFLPGTGFVNLRIFDMVGRLRKSFALGVQASGQQELVWDGKDDNGIDCAAGSYMYELSVNPYRASGDGQFSDINLRNVMIIVR